MSRILLVVTGCLCSFLAVVRPPSLSAAEKFWTGAAGDGMWWNAKNWSGESFAGYGDTVVFTNDSPISVSRAKFPDCSDFTYYDIPNRIYSFRGADVALFGGTLSLHGAADASPRPEIFVASGATVTISNNVSMFNNGPLAKTGGGVVRQYGDYSAGTSVSLTSEASSAFRLEEGTWEMESPGAGVYLQNTNVTISAGATFRLKGYNALNAKSRWQVDGTLCLDTCWSAVEISTLVGTGRISVANAGLGYSQKLKIRNGVCGPSAFSGTVGSGVSLVFANTTPVDAEDFTFTVGATDVFAAADLQDDCDLSALRFASGVGLFRFRSLAIDSATALAARDGDGRDVEVRLGALSQTKAGPVAVALSGGTFCAEPTVPAYDANRSLPQPAPFSILPASGSFRRSLSLDGCDAHFLNAGAQISELTVANGAAAHIGNNYAATSDKPAVIRLDGGSLRLATRDTQYGYSFPLSDAAPYVSLYVGANGGEIAAEDTRSSDSLLCNVLASAQPDPGLEAGTADGGLSLRAGFGPMRLHKPAAVSGGLRLADGRFVLASADALLATPKFLGLGDVSLTSTLLQFDGFAQSTALEVPGVLSYGESVTVQFRSAASQAANALTCGSLVRAGKGGVLFVYDPATLGDASAFRIETAPEAHANGVLKQPVVLDGSDLSLKFATCDPTKGLVPFAGAKDGASAGEGDVLSLASGSYALAAGAGKTVLGVAGASWKSLEIPAGAALRVGDGVNPALVLLNTTQVTGGGTLDFGTSEGVILANYHPEWNAVRCRIAGSGGVTFAGSAKFGRNVSVAGANGYSGGTWVSGVDLWVRNATAFGTGEVNVLGGARNGGKLLFDQSLTMANDFRIGGWGHPFYEWNVASNGYGAVVFKAPGVELAGRIALVGEARVSAEEAGDVGRLAGVVSGGRLSVYKGAGVVELLNDNVYTGGTEVVGATLAVAKGDGLGTGAVTLDQGVLRFVNAEAVTFMNAVTGVGQIVLAGTAPVTFTGASFAALPFRTLAAGTTLDVASLEDSEIVPHFDGETDLGGKSYAVAGVAGSGTVRNGTLTVTGEIRPGGAGRVGTLSFGSGALVSDGATYVCDVADETADRLVVSGDFDLSTLAFRAVRNGSARGDALTVLETSAGALAGEFASVTLARRAWKLAYGATAVRLDRNPGLLFILR